MKIYAISDLHLSLGTEKPMDIFGDVWAGHEEKIKTNWLRTVSPEDYVILPGDCTWGLHKEELIPDLQFLNSLPGHKILLKGNHDIWWETGSKLNRLKEEYSLDSLTFLHNNAIAIPQLSVVIAGTRGWKCPPDSGTAHIYKRELLRLELSLQKAGELASPADKILVFLHYPPFLCTPSGGAKQKTEFMDLLHKYNIEDCYYGHLHGHSHSFAVNGCLPQSNVNLHFVSAEYLGFQPIPVKTPVG